MLIDAHVHLDKYGDLLDDALSQIDGEEIFTVATAMDPESYGTLKRIGERSTLVLPIFGVHPRRAALYAGQLHALAPLIEESPAIGEIGLDFHWEKDPTTYPAQIKILEYFFAAAREQKKFVNLHTKGGERRILDLLEKYDVSRAIVHWYSGPLDILRAMIQYGCYFTVGVEVQFSDHIKTIAKNIPDHALLTETDNPGGLKWLTGATGMPKNLHGVIDALAELRGTTAQSIAEAVLANFARLIQDDPWLTPTRRQIFDAV
jgi:TatD DNase family protein